VAIFVSSPQDQLLKARDAMRAISRPPAGNHCDDHVRGRESSDASDKGNLAVLAVEDSVSRALGQGAVEPLDPASAEEETFPTSRLTWTRSMDSGVKGMRSHTPDERAISGRSVRRLSVRPFIYRSHGRAEMCG